MSSSTSDNLRKRRGKKASTIPTARGKRKEAIARAFIKPGTGNVFVNGYHVSTVTNPHLRTVITEPLDYFARRDTIDLSVSVIGGGPSGQAQAARTAIAKALVEYAKDDNLRKAMLSADRSLLVEDPRRVEPKKFKGPKARARFTKSYR